MSQVEHEDVEIDLSPFIRIAGKILDNNPIELDLIHMYKHIPNELNNPYVRFTQKILQNIYADNKEHPLSDIDKFIPKAKYVHTVTNFINLLDCYILNKVKPNVLDIVFKKYFIKEPTKIVAIYRVYYEVRNEGK